MHDRCGAPARELFGREFYFDKLAGFTRGGLPFPFAHGVHRRLRQYRMPALYIDSLDAAIRGDSSFDTDNPLQSHVARQIWIGRSALLDYAAFARSVLLRLGIGCNQQREKNDREQP